MLKKIFIAFCLASVFCQTAGFNFSRLISLYIDACGEKQLCLEWPDQTNYTFHPILRRCPPCSCDESCVRNLNCCPDKFFQRPLAILDTPNIYISERIKTARTVMPKYEIITACSNVSHVSEEDINSCETHQDDFLYRPVTSITSSFSYRNIFCAFCHGEKESDLKTWDIALKDIVVNFINFIESDSQLRFLSNAFKSTIIFTPPLSVKHIVKSIDTSKFEDLHEPCQEEVLRIACLSSYVNKFRSYQNVFCYMCKMKNWEKTGPLIKSCSNPNDNVSQKCLQRPESSITYPYKNFYCYTCNVPYRDKIYLGGDGCASEECNNNNTLYYSFIEFSFMTIESKSFEKFYLNFMNLTLNENNLVRFIQETDIRNAAFQNTNQFDANVIEDRLKSLALVNPNRVCRADLLPFDISNRNRQCSCSYSCLFVGKCTCCIDTAVLHPVECIPFYDLQEPQITRKSYPSDGIATVSTCYRNSDAMDFSPEYLKIAHLCERNLFDYDLLIWSNKVTYKNVFCFLCNTNFSIKNNVLEHESFDVLGFTIECSSQLNFVYAMSFNQVIRQMNVQGCRRSYDTHKSTMCKLGDASYISRCPQLAPDSPIKWLCENTSRNNFISVDQYKNEFCHSCNENKTKENSADLSVCMNRNTMTNMDKSICLDIGNQSSSNSCTDCFRNENPNFYRNWTVSDCKPSLGTKFYYKSKLVRDLFSPTWIIRDFKKMTSKSNAQNEDIICYPGRVLKDNKCVPVITYPKNIKYTLFILVHLSVTSIMNDTTKVLTIVKPSVHKTLKELFEISSLNRMDHFFFLPSKRSLDVTYVNDLFRYSLYVDIFFDLDYHVNFNRDATEKQLLQTPFILSIGRSIANSSISFHLKGIKFSNLSQALLSNDYILEEDIASFLLLHSRISMFLSPPSSGVYVCPLMLCRQKWLSDSELFYDVTKYYVIVKKTNEMLHIGDFVVDLNYGIRVCVKESHFVLGLSEYTDMLETLTTILNIISIVSMITLLVLYTIVPGLQTLPGLNIMSTTFSILCMQLTYTVANAIEKSTLFCVIVGVMLHYFWLTMCCCLFICSLHMCRSFTNLGGSISRHVSIRTVFVRYACFCYITPISVIAANIVITFSLHNNIGYGTKLCFVENFVQNLVTFIVPLLVTCVVNIVMFTLTVININFVKNLRKSREDKSELVIFIKLFSLTGIIWIFQMLDAVLQVSLFSFVATILTSSQGTVIFLSFASSSRILNYLKTIRNTDSVGIFSESKRIGVDKNDQKQHTERSINL